MRRESIIRPACEAEPTAQMGPISKPGMPSSIRSLRQQVVEFAGQLSFSSEELADIELAVGEACTNAVKHGSPRGNVDEVSVSCKRNENTLVVEVRDCGRGFDPHSLLPHQAGSMREGGMGIFLMQMLMDVVEFDFAHGTTVRMVKHCRPNPRVQGTDLAWISTAKKRP